MHYILHPTFWYLNVVLDNLLFLIAFLKLLKTTDPLRIPILFNDSHRIKRAQRKFFFNTLDLSIRYPFTS